MEDGTKVQLCGFSGILNHYNGTVGVIRGKGLSGSLRVEIEGGTKLVFAEPSQVKAA